MRKLSNKENRRFLFLGASILVFALYLIYSYNNIKGRSYIQEPIYIRIEGHIPDKTNLELVYQTFNDPTIIQKAGRIIRDSIPADTYIFRIDSSYRITNFIIYIQSLWEGEEMSLSSIKASIEGGQEFSFSLKSKDLIPSENLELNQLSNGATSIKKLPTEKSIGASLYFYTRTSIPGIFVSSGQRVPEIPSLIALLSILILGAFMVYILYPVIVSLVWKGISPGAVLLALAILIMPSGEQISNLLLALAIAAGFYRGIREGTLRPWVGNNRGLLLVILILIMIYSMAFIFSWDDPSSLKLLKIKFGLPMTLLAVALNIHDKQDTQIQYAALLSGVIISVFMHFGWTIMFVDAVEFKSKFISNPRYYMESAIFSRIHHSYLSVLYLATLASLTLKQDILPLRRREIVFFCLLIFIGLLFAFSRAAILALLLILVFFILKKILSLFKLEITRIARFIAAISITISILVLVFADLSVNPVTSNSEVKGFATRMELWNNGAELIKQKPVFGWGPGAYEDTLELTSSTSSYNNNTWRVLNTHNQFLETAGMFGLTVSIGLVWFLLFPTGFSRQHPRYSDFIITAGLIFATGFFFESLLNRNLGILVFGLCYGLLIKMKAVYDS